MIRYLRDGLLTMVSLTGHTINPFYAKMEIENTSDRDIDFAITQGQVIEQDRFRKVQNLAITGIIKIYKKSESSTRTYSADEWEIESINDKIFTIRAKSKETITVHCRCIDPTCPSPSGEKCNLTSVKNNKAASEDPKVTGTLKSDFFEEDDYNIYGE